MAEQESLTIISSCRDQIISQSMSVRRIHDLVRILANHAIAPCPEPTTTSEAPPTIPRTLQESISELDLVLSRLERELRRLFPGTNPAGEYTTQTSSGRIR